MTEKKAVEILHTFETNLLRYGKQDSISYRYNYQKLADIYNKIDIQVKKFEMLYKGGILEKDSAADKFAHSNMYVEKNEIDRAEKIIQDMISKMDFEFFTYMRILRFYGNTLKDENKAVDFLNFFISELDKQPYIKRNYSQLKTMHSTCKKYGIEYDVYNRIKKESKRILDYLDQLRTL